MRAVLLLWKWATVMHPSCELLVHAGMALDLRAIMQRTSFVLQGNASLARAYRLFRTMGLHHLYVGPPKPRVIGLLTRKVPHHISCLT